jgi:uncharacterized 2Fe-2S/4Fe-4S cluster protein (DUF4445 family)
MAEHKVIFDTSPEPVFVPTGTLLIEAAQKAGVEIMQPCGGQGRCGRCAVKVEEGTVRRRSTLRLSAEDVEKGYALACQTVIESDVEIVVPPQEKIQRRLTTDRTAAEVSIPAGYNPAVSQTIKWYDLTIDPPDMEDQTDDWSRFRRTLRQQSGIENVRAPLRTLRTLGPILREANWKVTAVFDSNPWDCPESDARLIALYPYLEEEDRAFWGVAVDIGTTTVSLWLVDLRTGKVEAQVAEYNGQIARGEDVISRIVYSSKGRGSEEMSSLVVGTINELLERACKRAQVASDRIVKMTIAGNSTMIHLLLGLPASSIRLDPFVTAINHVPPTAAHQIGLNIHPEASVDCLPGVASYVGADITAGVLSSGMNDTDKTTLFMDVGTNGEIVFGSNEWLVTCAASAGPAFEGAGVKHGMRATRGAIEEVWINSENYEPTFRVIGGVKPQGLCGSGLISLLAEMFLSGVVDKAGNVQIDLNTQRTRMGEHGGEYIVAWGDETSHGEDIVITHVDIDNLLRAKAAIYAGYTVLAESVGVPLEMVEQVLIGGSFGKYINVEKAVEIGLLPDKPWNNFHFLGNTSVQGTYLALIDKNARSRIRDIANRMTYIELSADNSFYDAFMSALFLPHTDMSRFPTVDRMIKGKM